MIGSSFEQESVCLGTDEERGKMGGCVRDCGFVVQQEFLLGPWS